MSASTPKKKGPGRHKAAGADVRALERRVEALEAQMEKHRVLFKGLAPVLAAMAGLPLPRPKKTKEKRRGS
ncbi:MAG TPA: hypothetical protein VHC69_14385 [Polyangiaceae bacterium]|nr:hypothetical protein [Polyangiaceae bacterium]